MSHPQPGHDYSEKHKEESSKEHALRKAKSISSLRKTDKLGDSLKRYLIDGEKEHSTKGHKAGALKKAKVTDKGVKYLSKTEQKDKTKGWPKASESSFPTSNKEKDDYQRRYKRAWND